MQRRILAALRFHNDRLQEKFGLIARRHRFGDSFTTDLRTLLPRNALAVDVGANVGQTIRAILAAQPEATVHAFEPGQEAWDELLHQFGADARVHLHKKAVAPSTTPVELHVMRGTVGSSLLRPGRSDKAWLDEVRTDIVDAVRLDEFIGALPDGAAVDLLKVDTQGFDLEALRSAGDLLTPRRVRAVTVEINFERFYEGQARAVDIVELLTDAGYRPAAFYQLHRSPSRTIEWLDALFLPA